jgi:hypothetical protein
MCPRESAGRRLQKVRGELESLKRQQVYSSELHRRAVEREGSRERWFQHLSILACCVSN